MDSNAQVQLIAKRHRRPVTNIYQAARDKQDALRMTKKKAENAKKGE